MPWYDGPTLMGISRRVEVDDDAPAARAVPHAGAVGQPPEPRLPRLRRARSPAARVAPGRPRRVLPSGPREHGRAHRHLRRRPRRRRSPGQSVTLTLADEIDVSRGDVIAAADAPPRVADQFEATIVWMDEEPMLPRPRLPDEDRHAHGRRHDRRRSKYKVNVNTLEHLAGEHARAQRDRRLRRSSSTGRSPSIPTPRTATSAASS